MRVILDACVPARFAAWLQEHEVSTVHEALGSSDFDDRALLEALRGHCEALITVDKSIPFQQVVADLPYGLIIIRTRSNRLEHLIPLAPATLTALKGLVSGEVRRVGV